MESKILLQPCSPEKDKNKKKSRKRGTTEPEPRDNLRRRPCSTGEEKKKKRQKKETLTDAPEPELPLFSRGLVLKERKKKKSKYGSPPESLITTVTKTTIDTTSITIITPPEDPNDHIHLYLCIGTALRALSWFKIDPTDTTLEAPKPKSSSSSSSNNYNDNDNSKGKLKKKKPILLRQPISHMPPTIPYGFRAIPHSSSCLAKGKRKKKKLVYAVGGGISVNSRSSKAFFCDFASNKPVWKELPPMPSPMYICMGVASPLDGNVYAFGPMLQKAPGIPCEYAGLVFDPSSPSWKQCPPPFTGNQPNRYPINDYALANTENRTELCVFTCSTQAHSFNLATAQWDRNLYAPVPAKSLDVDSSSVGVGHLIFKFHDRKLYALDTTSPKPSFKPVPGLDNKLPKCWGGGDMVYLGKGKLCIIWSSIPKKPPRGTVSIACLMFWVGMCNRRNRLRAVIDRCERFVAHGLRLCNVFAL
ncbi:hypothetical protein LguiB_000137 [Lonicera macranthoides]